MNGLKVRTTGFVLVVACVLAGAAATPAFAVGGDLDPDFGGDGRVVTAFTQPAAGSAVAIQADGKIVVAGTAGSRFALTRYKADGSRDGTFGINGRVLTSFSADCVGANAVAIQADGKIVAAGGASSGPGCSVGTFALARYDTHGSLDTTFGGGDGKVRTKFKGSVARGVAIQANGKIVAVGGGGVMCGFAVARFKANGSLDGTFGGDGRVRNGCNLGYSEARGVAIQSNGRIVAVGVVDFYGFALARYLSDGSLDPSFSGDGQVSTIVGPGEGGATSVDIQSNGRIVAAGSTNGPHEGGDMFGPSRFALARYAPGGQLDSTFGNGGIVKTRFGDHGSGANGVAIRASKIVAAGSRDLEAFALVRYDLDGTRDTTFGGDGRVTTRFKVGGATAYGVAVQSDGKVVAAGWAAGRFGLARYLSS